MNVFKHVLKGWKLERNLLSIVMVAALASTAMAASVTINHGGGTLTGTLSGLNVDYTGNVILTVTENLTGGGGTCTNNRPTISVPNPPTTAIVGAQISASFTTSDADGQNVTVTPNVGSISGNTWSWTPSASGTNIVTLTANDGQTCNNTATYSWSVNVTSSGGGGGVPTSTKIPMQTKVTGSLNSGGYQYFYFSPTSAVTQIFFQMYGTLQWVGNADIFISTKSQPDCSILPTDGYSFGTPDTGTDGLWYSIKGGSYESIALNGNFSAGTIFLVTVCERGSGTSFTLYWNGY
jgi:hypothetical protein